MMLIIILYGVTPLSSTLISKESVNRKLTLTFEPAGLLAAETQPDTLSTAFSYVAYSHQYLNGTLPPFTTEDFAVLPLRPRSLVSVAKNETWVANSTLYEARLECTAGTVEYRDDEGMSRLSNADGDCAFFLPDYDTAQAYSPYVSGIFNKDILKREVYMKRVGKANCTGEVDHVLIGFFGRTTAEFAKKMALTKFMNSSLVFCTPIHEQQQVEVTVDATTSALQSWRRIGEKTPFTGLDTEYWGDLLVSLAASASTEAFNITHDADALPKITTDFQSWRLPDHGSQLKNMPQFQTLRDQYGSALRAVTQVGWDFDGDRQQPTNVYFINPQSLSPFGLGKEANLESLFDSTAPGEALADMYDQAYRYLFAMAIGSGLATFDGLADNTTLAARQVSSVSPDTSGKRTFTQDGYVVDPVWVRVLQGVLGGVVMLNAILIGLTYNRSSELRGEPGSIASAMVHVDRSVLHDFQDVEYRTSSQLKASLKAKGHLYCMKAEKIMATSKYGEELGTISETAPGWDTEIDRSRVRLTKPWDLSVAAGIIATLFLVGVMIALVVLFCKQKRQQGFRVPVGGFVYDLYANYLPTVLAAVFESFLVLLAIQVTLLFPFKKLTRGNSRATSSLCANYDKTPPHLQVINAMRVRNGLLASLSMCILAANVLAVAFGGLFHKSTVDFQEFGDVAIAGSEAEMEAFNSTTLVSGQFDTDLSAFYSSTGETLGFEPRPWTTGELFYVPFTIQDTSMRLSTNYTFSTLGFGVNFTCEKIPEPEIIEWHSMVQVVNASSRGIQNRTFSFLTFVAQNNTPLLWKSLADTNVYRFANVDDLESAAMTFVDEGYWNGSKRNTYYEYAPVKYPDELQQDWDFFASWGTYRLDEDRKVTINRVFFPKTIYVNATGSSSDNYYDADFPYNGTTVEGPSIYIADRTIIRCKSKPRLVNSTIMADLNGKIYDHNDTEIELTGDLLKPANDTVLGLNGVLGKFQNMVLRVAGRSGGAQGVASLLGGNPRPANWMTFLVNQHGRSVVPDFDLYSHPDQSVKSMEAVYKRTFAIYLQLYSDKIFPNISSTATAASEGQNVRAMYTRPETRVLMQPVAFYVSLVLLVLFVPAVIWTFASLYHGFLTHQPTSLAGLYASLYASCALEDAKGTGHMDEKDRARTMDATGARYGYGWFVGRDGEIHVGIEREPLFRNKPQ
jgi:hypothetical protein